MVASLEKLKAILPQLDAQPELLEEGFQWLSVAPEVKFTGYYSPVMQASRTRKPGYEYPIYRLPEELAPDLAWCLPTHSCPEDAFLQVIDVYKRQQQRRAMVASQRSKEPCPW